MESTFVPSDERDGVAALRADRLTAAVTMPIWALATCKDWLDAAALTPSRIGSGVEFLAWAVRRSQRA
jgi:hypothetical protein